nr:ATP-binding protein [Paenochrobactrum gallinarii]
MPALAESTSAQCSAEIIDISAAKAGPDGRKSENLRWEAVTLPNYWNQLHSEYSDEVWYRIHWRQTCSEAGHNPVALLIQTINMAGEVFVNDHFLWRDKSLTEPLSRSWSMPRYWVLHDAWLTEGINTLWVKTVGVKGQALGLGSVIIGEPTQVQSIYDNYWWRQRTLYVANVIVSGVIGILFFCIWIIRRDQTYYGWYAFSSLFWLVFIANVLVTTPWPFSDSVTFVRVNAIALLLNIACFCMFTLRFGELVLKRYERFLWGIFSVFIVALAFTPQDYLGAIQISSVLVAVGFFLFNCLQFPVLTFRKRNNEYFLFSICLIVLFMTIPYDALLLFRPDPEKFPILPYANIVITLCLAGILGLRQAHNVRRIEQFNVELAESIANARSELAVTLEREHFLELKNAKLRERLDIAHDLHDGIGGTLVHMMAKVEQGSEQVHRPQVISMLKLLRDDLRQTIDHNSSPSTKVPATPQEWIAPLRHRFSILFDELGIKSDWQFPSAWRSTPSTLQCLALTRVVEEALTNLIKHSRAQQVCFRLQQQSPNELVLELEDDGIGFDVLAVQTANISVGMRSMSTRILKVGGRLEIASTPGRTIVKVIMATNIISDSHGH